MALSNTLTPCLTVQERCPEFQARTEPRAGGGPSRSPAPSPQPLGAGMHLGEQSGHCQPA